MALFYAGDDLSPTIEQGSFAPQLRVGSSLVTMVDADGYYIRIGRRVIVNYHLVWSGSIQGDGGNLTMQTPNGWEPDPTFSLVGLAVPSNTQRITPDVNTRTLGLRAASGSSVVNFTRIRDGKLHFLRGSDTNSSGTKVLGGTYEFLVDPASL